MLVTQTDLVSERQAAAVLYLSIDHCHAWSALLQHMHKALAYILLPADSYSFVLSQPSHERTSL